MSELYTSSPETAPEVVVEPPVATPEVVVEPPVAPEEQPPASSGVGMQPPVPPSSESETESEEQPPIPPSSESETETESEEQPPVPPSESETETETESETETAPDSPPLDAEYLGLRRREVGCSMTPTMGPSRTGDLTEGEMSDLEDNAPEEDIDVGRVPDVETLIADTLSAEGLLGATVRVPVWVVLTVVIVFAAYLCLLIGTGILAVRRPR